MTQGPGLCPGVFEAHVPEFDFIVDIVPLFHSKGAFVHFVREVEKFIYLDQVLIVEPQVAELACETTYSGHKTDDGRLIQEETSEAEHADIDLCGDKEEDRDIDSRVQKNRQHPIMPVDVARILCPLWVQMISLVLIQKDSIHPEYDVVNCKAPFGAAKIGIQPRIVFCNVIQRFRYFLRARRRYLY